jgi:hypothetical protein
MNRGVQRGVRYKYRGSGGKEIVKGLKAIVVIRNVNLKTLHKKAIKNKEDQEEEKTCCLKKKNCCYDPPLPAQIISAKSTELPSLGSDPPASLVPSPSPSFSPSPELTACTVSPRPNTASDLLLRISSCSSSGTRRPLMLLSFGVEVPFEDEEGWEERIGGVETVVVGADWDDPAAVEEVVEEVLEVGRWWEEGVVERERAAARMAGRDRGGGRGWW